MARSRRKGGGSPILFYAMMALVSILLTAVVYMPLLRVAGLMLCRSQGAGREPEANIPEETIATLAELEAELVAKLGRLRKIEEEALAADLSVNVDGSFHRGSRLGKRLNAEIENLVPRIEELRDVTADLRCEPLSGLRRCLDLTAASASLGYALAAYGVVFGYLYLFDPAIPMPVSPFVDSTILLHLRGVETHAYGAAAYAGLASLVLLALFYLVVRHRLFTQYAALRQSFIVSVVVRPRP